jgi:hypothetical protein
MNFWYSIVSVRITLPEKGKYSSIGGTSNCGLEGFGFNSQFLPINSLSNLTVKILISYIGYESSILSLSLMLIVSIILILLSSAVNNRRDVAILYNRIAILVLFYCVLNDFSCLMITTNSIGVHGGLLLVTSTAQIFHVFIYIITGLILTLTSFYPRKV